MLRLRCTDLQDSDGVLINEGYPFAGIVFYDSNPLDIKAYLYEVGRKKRSYICHKNIEYVSGSKVDFSTLKRNSEDDIESSYSLNDQLFTGLAYRFEGKYCTKELLFDDGWLVGEIVFSLSGSVLFSDACTGELEQRIQFFEDGVLKEIGVRAERQFSFQAEFNRSSQLEAMWVDTHVGSVIRDYQDHILYPLDKLFDEQGQFRVFVPAERIFLTGLGVDDCTIKNLVPVKHRSKYIELVLCKTSVSQNVVDQLISDGLENIKYS